MKTYKVIVNGTSYEVSLEVMDAKDVKTAPAAPAAAPAPAPAPAVEKAAPAAPAAPTAPAPANGEAVRSPMPGTILDVKVASGAAVKKGDILVILEAM